MEKSADDVKASLTPVKEVCVKWDMVGGNGVCVRCTYNGEHEFEYEFKLIFRILINIEVTTVHPDVSNYLPRFASLLIIL